jgi:hypothetical protein
VMVLVLVGSLILLQKYSHKASESELDT